MKKSQLVAAPLLAAAAFVGLYVAYAHAASWLRRGEYSDIGYRYDFSDADALAPFALAQSGPLGHAIADGELRIDGSTGAGSARSRFELSLPPRRLEEGLYSARFRADERAVYEVYLGISSGNGESERRFTVSLHAGPDAPRLIVRGDPDPRAPPIEGSRELRSFALTAPPAPGALCELALVFNRALGLIEILDDGALLGSVAVGWQAGALVRPVFGVSGRDAGQPLHVALRELAYSPHRPDARALDFDERFSGAVLNPERWTFQTFNPEETTSRLALEGGALRLVAERRGRAAQDNPVAFNLALPVFEAESFAVEALLEPGALRGGSIYLGLSNSGPGASHRWFEIGLADGHAYAAGSAPSRGGEQLHAPLAPGAVRLALAYDAATRRIRAEANGALLEQPSDLQPLEPITVHLGSKLAAPDAQVDVRLLRVQFARRAP